MPSAISDATAAWLRAAMSATPGTRPPEFGGGRVPGMRIAVATISGSKVGNYWPSDIGQILVVNPEAGDPASGEKMLAVHRGEYWEAQRMSESQECEPATLLMSTGSDFALPGGGTIAGQNLSGYAPPAAGVWVPGRIVGSVFQYAFYHPDPAPLTDYVQVRFVASARKFQYRCRNITLRYADGTGSIPAGLLYLDAPDWADEEDGWQDAGTFSLFMRVSDGTIQYRIGDGSWLSVLSAQVCPEPLSWPEE